MATAWDITLMLARLSYNTICASKKIGATPILTFLNRAPSPTGNSFQVSTPKPDTSVTSSPSVRPCFGLPFCLRRTPSCFSLTLLARISRRMVSPPPTSWPWLWAPPYMDSLVCSFLTPSPESTLRSAGPSFPLSPSGAPVRFLFLWYWDRTRDCRTFLQWNLLGFLAGLMVDVYFPNGVFLLLPLIESILAYWNSWRAREFRAVATLFAANCSFTVAMVLAFLPTLVTRSIIFGGLFRFGSYTTLPWDWTAPNWRVVLFSSEHGLLTWTPILALSILGLFFASPQAKSTTRYLAVAAAAFYYVISSYPYWHGMASFGNRFFISLTPIFIFGLALLLQRFAQLFRSPRRAFVAASALIFLLVAWNAGLIFQWGSHLIPARGPVSFSEITRNQFFVVPRQLSADLQRYLFKRKALMQQIEERDIQQFEKNPPPP